MAHVALGSWAALSCAVAVILMFHETRSLPFSLSLTIAHRRLEALERKRTKERRDFEQQAKLQHSNEVAASCISFLVSLYISIPPKGRMAARENLPRERNLRNLEQTYES